MILKITTTTNQTKYSRRGYRDGGLYIGAGKDLDAATFFSGLIDDVRIFNRAVTP